MTSLITSRFDHPNFAFIDNRIVSRKTNNILHIYSSDNLYSYNFFYMTLPNGSEYFISNNYIKSKNIVQITVKNLFTHNSTILYNKTPLVDIVSVDINNEYFIGLFDNLSNYGKTSLYYAICIFDNIFPNIHSIIRFNNIVDCNNDYEYYDYKFDNFFTINNKEIVIKYKRRNESMKLVLKNNYSIENL